MALRQKNTKIKWSYPHIFENALQKDICKSGIGIYCISRIFNSKETIIYIGKAESNFVTRLKSHEKEWLHLYKGIKKIRLGLIVEPKKIIDKIIPDVENGLIYEIKPIQNLKSTKGYTFYNYYKIQNIGYRGKIPKIVDMKEHIL